MRYFRTFVYSLFKSATSTEYYFHIIQTPAVFTLKFFLGFCIIAAGLNTTIVYHHTIIPLKPVVGNIPNQLAQVFPEDLQITVLNGSARINQPEPYFITLDVVRQVLFNIGRQVLGTNSSEMQNLLVIDTEATIEDYFRYQTLSLLTKDTFIYRDPNQGLGPSQIKVKAIPLTGLTATINQPIVAIALQELQPYLQSLFPLIFFLIFLGSLIILPYIYLFQIILFSLISFFILKLIDLKLTYTSMLQISTHLLAPIILVSLILKLLDLYPQIPLLTVMVYTLASIPILTRVKYEKFAKRQALKAR